MEENHMAIIHFVWAGELGAVAWVSLFYGLACAGLTEEQQVCNLIAASYCRLPS